MSIRKVVAGLLIAAGIAIMAVPFFWRTTGEKQTEQLISEFEQTLEDDYNEETDVEEEQTSISEEDEAILKAVSYTHLDVYKRQVEYSIRSGYVKISYKNRNGVRKEG